MLKIGDIVTCKKEMLAFPNEEDKGKIIALTKQWCVWQTPSGFEYALKINNIKKLVEKK